MRVVVVRAPRFLRSFASFARSMVGDLHVCPQRVNGVVSVGVLIVLFTSHFHLLACLRCSPSSRYSCQFCASVRHRVRMLHCGSNLGIVEALGRLSGKEMGGGG
jgi:hypothetical protein